MEPDFVPTKKQEAHLWELMGWRCEDGFWLDRNNIRWSWPPHYLRAATPLTDEKIRMFVLDVLSFEDRRFFWLILRKVLFLRVRPGESYDLASKTELALMAVYRPGDYAKALFLTLDGKGDEHAT